MRKAGYQAKTVCGNLQMCAGLEAGIEGVTHAVGQQIPERTRARRSEEVVRVTEEEEDSESGVSVPNNLNIETTGTEEEADEGLEADLNMEMEVMVGDEVEGKEGGNGNLRKLGAL